MNAAKRARGRAALRRYVTTFEQSLPQFLDHYVRSGPWQLVVNGDFIDFWNIEIGDGATDPEQLAVERLHRVLCEYPGVEDALISFLETL